MREARRRLSHRMTEFKFLRKWMAPYRTPLSPLPSAPPLSVYDEAMCRTPTPQLTKPRMRMRNKEPEPDSISIVKMERAKGVLRHAASARWPPSFPYPIMGLTPSPPPPPPQAAAPSDHHRLSSSRLMSPPPPPLFSSGRAQRTTTTTRKLN